jgi:FlaA1/EpsC-like NDP-sugar epimerase
VYSLNEAAVRQTTFGKVILVTGAGGSIGSALVTALQEFRPRHLVLLDHSERNLSQILVQLDPSSITCQVSAVLGSVCDERLLLELFETYRPEVVYHAAAFKHVPLMETNPLAAILNNALATYALAKLARAKAVSKLVLISTDKAVNPISIMGASKRLAELAVTSIGDSTRRTSIVRLGNVLGTEGSVVPLFLSQISRGGPVTVTDPKATRYFLSLDEAVDLIVQSSAETSGGIFIPKVNEPVNILQLALEMIKNSKSENYRNIEVSFTGLRPGDKLSEQFLYSDESATPTDYPSLLRVFSKARDSGEFDINMKRLSKNVQLRDTASALRVVRQLVPQYRPTETVTRLSQGTLACDET